MKINYCLVGYLVSELNLYFMFQNDKFKINLFSVFSYV